MTFFKRFIGFIARLARRFMLRPLQWIAAKLGINVTCEPVADVKKKRPGVGAAVADECGWYDGRSVASGGSGRAASSASAPSWNGGGSVCKPYTPPRDPLPRHTVNVSDGYHRS